MELRELLHLTRIKGGGENFLTICVKIKNQNINQCQSLSMKSHFYFIKEKITLRKIKEGRKN